MEFFSFIRKMKGIVSDTELKGDFTANAFNDYFLNACEPRVSPISDYCFASEINEQTLSIHFSYVTDEEACTLFKELKTKS